MAHKYIFAADLTRTVSIIGVIGIHLVTQISERPDFFGGNLWWLTFLLNILFRTGVPLFMMLSGYLVLGKTENIQTNFSKIWARLLIPLITFYTLYTLAAIYFADYRGLEYNYWDIFHHISQNTQTSLYFLVVLAFIWVLNPVWNILTQKQNLPIFEYTWRFFFTLSAVAGIFYYLSLRDGVAFNTFTYWILWLAYYFYGYKVRLQEAFLSQKQTILYATLFIGGFVATVILDYFTVRSFNTGGSELLIVGGQAYGNSYLSVSLMAMSFSLFQLLMRTRWLENLKRFTWLQRSIAFAASLSFAMYLIHVLVMEVQRNFLSISPDSPTMPGLWGFLFINTAITFVGTVVVAWIWKQIPGLKILVGDSNRSKR